MSELAKMFAGITLLMCPALPLFCVYLVRQKRTGTTESHMTGLLAGIAHSGGLIVLSLVAQILIDQTKLSDGLEWVIRFTFPFVAFLMALCNFNAAMNKSAARIGEFNRYKALSLVLFCFSVIVLGVGLVNNS